MRARSLRPQRPLSGQAALEYVLLVLVCVTVFGYLFYQIRRDLFKLWVCEIGPRVQSPVPCESRNKCFEVIGKLTTSAGLQKLQAQKRACDSMYQ